MLKPPIPEIVLAKLHGHEATAIWCRDVPHQTALFVKLKVVQEPHELKPGQLAEKWTLPAVLPFIRLHPLGQRRQLIVEGQVPDRLWDLNRCPAVVPTTDAEYRDSARNRFFPFSVDIRLESALGDLAERCFQWGHDSLDASVEASVAVDVVYRRMMNGFLIPEGGFEF